jgi:anthranilate 1,2-dioxygenase large subunit
VARGPDGAISAFVNRCAHRGNLLCLTEKGHNKEITCIYHGWTYDLAGKLTGVAFERGIKRQGGMPPEFRKDDHHLQRLRVAELSGLVFGTFSDEVEDLETYLGPLVVGGVRRVLNRPAKIIGRSTQILPNNWKLYAENVKDTYHASILHAFLTTFRINRLSQPGSINIDDSGGNHFSQAKMDYAAEDAEYNAAQLRSDTDLKLADNSIIDPIDEYGDQVSVQILTVFPNMVLQQIRNTIAVRVLRPRGVDRSELEWVHLGFADDDEAMTERRLRHGNLVGPAGYIALEDGCVGGFVQRALQYNDDDSGIVMMGGHDAESQTFRASEAAIRGFWKKYRALTGA